MIYGIDIGGFHMKITQITSTEPLKAISVFLPFLERKDMIKKLVTFITDPDLTVVTQTVSANRRLFSSFKEGTHYLVDTTERLFKNVQYVGLPCRLYSSKEAKKHYLRVACRNWVATCYLVSSYLKLFENGLVIDCGTTSTDIVPVVQQNPVTLEDHDQAYTRLRTGELLWSGLYNTHIASLQNTVVLDDEEFTIKSTMRTMSYDVYIVLKLVTPEALVAMYGGVAEEVSSISYESSVDKILDLIAADRDVLTVKDAKKIAEFLAEKQREKTEKAIKKVLSGVKKKYKVDIGTVSIVGAGKDIILREALKGLNLEVIDIEKAASEQLGAGIERNCETSLGCALMGLQE